MGFYNIVLNETFYEFYQLASYALYLAPLKPDTKREFNPLLTFSRNLLTNLSGSASVGGGHSVALP